MGRPARAARRLAAWALAVLAWTGEASARSLQLEDLLQRQSFGQVSLSADGHWLLVEERAPLTAGARFDWGALNVLFRTHLMAADLSAHGPLRTLFQETAGAGYRAGPISPDGAHAVVYRLTTDRWELGVATFATRSVRWLGVTPEAPGDTRTLQWASSTELIAITLVSETFPFDIRYERPQAAAASLWAAAARGEPAVTVTGSGRWIGAHAPPDHKTVVAVSVEDGAQRTLATGDVVDLELSPSGRWLALTEAGAEIPMQADAPAQGPYGIAGRRMRLHLLDLRTGRSWSLPGPRDVLTTLLAWSRAHDELLAYVRPDGLPWTDGELVRIDPAAHQVRAAAPGLQLCLWTRPERVFAGWWGEEPLVFGHAPGATRDDWWRLSRQGPVRLTAALAAPGPQGVVVGRRSLLLAADDAAWSIDRAGRARRLAAPFAPVTPRVEGFPDRTVFALPEAEALNGVLTRGAERRFVRVRAVRAREGGAPLGSSETVLAVAGSQVVSEAVTGGGERALMVRDATGSSHDLALINVRLADIDRPAPIAVHHRGADGRPLTSWLFLPARRPGSPPPPLVIVPYPGTVHRAAPNIWDEPPMIPSAVLLGAGYAVLAPSLPAAPAGQGPAQGLAAQVLAIVDAAAAQPDLRGRFDPKRLALWGHSFGGYAVLSMVGQSDRFRAAVATAPATDLISVWGQFGPSRLAYTEEGPTTPWSAAWVEEVQPKMGAPPWADPQRYLTNSPIMLAGRVTTPVLIAAGELDGSHPGQAQELFSALYRQDKDALLLTYWGEPHLFGSPGNLRDLYGRALAFLSRCLGESTRESSARVR